MTNTGTDRAMEEAMAAAALETGHANPGGSPEPAVHDIEWNLELAALASASPRQMLPRVRSAAVAAGGWVLSEGAVSQESAEIDFELPRQSAMGLYGSVLELGLELTADSHAQLEQLLGCTRLVRPSARMGLVRMHMTLFSRDGCDLFLGERARRSSQPM